MFTEDLLREMSKNLVLPAFRFRWLLHIHWLIRLISFWKASKSPLEEVGLYNIMSSANKRILVLEENRKQVMSLI